MSNSNLLNAKSPRLVLIAALAKDRVIGIDNQMPWQLPEDLKRFKALTLGHPIIMGRKTWESLGRPLPGRSNIVVSRNPGYAAPGASVVHSLKEAIALAAGSGAENVFVIGGAEIYRQALPLAWRLELTEIAADFPGDAYFPEFDTRAWLEISRERHHSTNGFDYAFVTYERH
ncbi:MAG TPA: dihydrofolate reductase [Rhodocyclaceae bacterium]|nr:dihydrofolate reductase [Rhodocyclaceae bacterium]